MVPSNKGDDVADTPQQREENDALAAQIAEHAHTLLPPEIAAQLPPLHANDPLVRGLEGERSGTAQTGADQLECHRFFSPGWAQSGGRTP